jgi:cell fate (sporulation/competence/biofilm development) regulator YlbF (YheA/YmcA/DUF963 family)
MADKLGKSIAESDAGRKYRQARQQMQSDAEAHELMQQFQQHVEKLQRSEQAGQPIEVEDKNTLEELQGKLAANPKVKTFTEAQMDYMDLIRQVSQRIQDPMNAADAEEGQEQQ